MYLVGGAHPNKADAVRILERLVSERQRLVTDAEVFQEILHRYAAIGRRDAMQPAFDVLSSVVDEVLPITEADVVLAKDVLGTHQAITARDAIHVAVMRRHGITRILSFDRGFDGIRSIERLGRQP